MHTRFAIRCALSAVLGFLLLIPVGALYGFAGLPVYHGWGLAHGSFTTALPALIEISFLCLGLIPWFGPVVDPVPRIMAALAVFPLVTTLFWVDQQSGYARFSGEHMAIYAGTFCLLAVLCLKSRKPLLVPLYLLIPILIDPAFGLLSIGLAGATAVTLFAHDFLWKVLPVLVVSAAAFAVARYVHLRRA